MPKKTKTVFDPLGTELEAKVKEKREDLFLRYNHRTGTIKNDSHFVTVFVLPNGEEVTSYSKKHFIETIVGKTYKLKISFCKISNDRYLLYV